MARSRIRLLTLLATATVALAAYVVAAPDGLAPVPHGARRAARTGYGDAVYPHLANYNGLRSPGQIPFFTSYGLIVARRGAPVRQLQQVAPDALTYLYERTLQVDMCCVRALYGLAPLDVPPQWWLLLAGSRLRRSIGARQQWITVDNPAPFSRCQDVLVDGESMHVWSVRGHTLHVLRGYYSRALPHAAGARIAPHYSYRHDLSNCRLFGRVTSVRPWSFNLSSRCPRWHGQTWADYLAHRLAMLVRRDGWRGIFYDNLTDFPPTPAVDVDDDGLADGGVIGGVDVWRAGERALLAETRRLLPRVPLLVNGDLLIDGLADGREMEGFPLIPGAALSAALDAYLYDTSRGMRRTIVNPDSVTRHVPSMPAVQMAVGAALLGDGYTAYDFGWLDHGYPWWFDEFDAGAGSATTHAIDAQTMIVPVAHARRFHGGDIVLADLEAMRVLRVLAHGLLVQRGALGTTATRHLARTVITTPRQREAGAGYLGRAVGPPRVVATDARTLSPVPVHLLPGPARIGRGRRITAPTRLEPHTDLRVDARVHYDPMATRVVMQAPASPLALRTLTFRAKGPAGQALWLSDGRNSMPLVLRSTWHRYMIPIGGVGRITLGFGRVGGTVALSGIRLLPVQGFVWRRDFTRGAVIVNPTDVVQRLRVGPGYRLLAGDQNPWANTGRPARQVSVARYRAAILLET